jgi:hypothetical protein
VYVPSAAARLRKTAAAMSADKPTKSSCLTPTGSARRAASAETAMIVRAIGRNANPVRTGVSSSACCM